MYNWFYENFVPSGFCALQISEINTCEDLNERLHGSHGGSDQFCIPTCLPQVLSSYGQILHPVYFRQTQEELKLPGNLRGVAGTERGDVRGSPDPDLQCRGLHPHSPAFEGGLRTPGSELKPWLSLRHCNRQRQRCRISGRAPEIRRLSGRDL